VTGGASGSAGQWSPSARLGATGAGVAEARGGGAAEGAGGGALEVGACSVCAMASGSVSSCDLFFEAPATGAGEHGRIRPCEWARTIATHLAKAMPPQEFASPGAPSTPNPRPLTQLRHKLVRYNSRRGNHLHPCASTRGAYEFKELGRKSATRLMGKRGGEVVAFEQTGDFRRVRTRSDVNQEEGLCCANLRL